MSFPLTDAYSQSKAYGYLKSKINFYDQAEVVDSTQIIDQYKTTIYKATY